MKKVIGSNGNLDLLIAGISKWYGNSTISLIGDDFPKKVSTLKGVCAGVEVIRKGRRFQFVRKEVPKGWDEV